MAPFWYASAPSLSRAPVPDLVLGPLLRHVGPADANRSRTFRVDDHHYALVRATGLESGAVREYEVKLDGQEKWPEPGSLSRRA